jgi:uncharacterized membrane protein
MATTIQVERTAATNSPEGRYLSRQPWMVSLAALYLVALFTLAWYRHATYRSFGYDLGYFDQSVWLMAHGHAPFVTLIGRDIFADHFSPVLILFVPFYAIVSTPAWLLGGQALALGVGLIALGSLLDQLEVPRRWHIALALAYVSSPALWNAGLYDFHTSTLAVPFLLVGLTAALRDDARMLALMSLVVVLARDDLALAVVALLLVGFR